MTPAITIGSATAADQPALSRLGLVVQNDHAAAEPHVFRPDITPLGEDYVAQVLANDSAALLVAKQGGDLVGCLVVNLRRSPNYPVFQARTFARVDTLVVDPAMQGRGIGRLLMEAARAWASDRGASSLELDVWEFNTAAIAFYQHLGLQTTRRVMSLPLAPFPNGTGKDATESTR